MRRDPDGWEEIQIEGPVESVLLQVATLHMI